MFSTALRKFQCIIHPHKSIFLIFLSLEIQNSKMIVVFFSIPQNQCARPEPSGGARGGGGRPPGVWSPPPMGGGENLWFLRPILLQ